MSSIRLACPSCSYALTAPGSQARHGVRCSRCGARLVAVPTPPPLPAEPRPVAGVPVPWWAVVLAIAVPLLLLAAAVIGFVALLPRPRP